MVMGCRPCLEDQRGTSMCMMGWVPVLLPLAQIEPEVHFPLIISFPGFPQAGAEANPAQALSPTLESCAAQFSSVGGGLLTPLPAPHQLLSLESDQGRR